MTFYRDLGTRTMATPGRYVRAVGWLHPDHPYPLGRVPPEFLTRLQRFATSWLESTQALGWGLFRGRHGCQFCSKACMFGNFGVPSDEVLFVCPEMVAHYVEAHGYAPPAEFAAAVLRSPLTGTEEYREAVERFRRLHRRRGARRRRTGRRQKE
jgi:hypothetical protein